MNARELSAHLKQILFPRMREALDAVTLQLDVAQKLDQKDQDLAGVIQLVLKIKQEFVSHLEKEENLFFPIIHSETTDVSSLISHAELTEFISELKTEHEQNRSTLNSLRRMTNQYQFPSSAPPSKKLAYALLNDLEQDFNRLYYIEEEHIFPKVSAYIRKS